jgi:hypothetical protein
MAGQNRAHVLQPPKSSGVQDECRSWITVQEVCGQCSGRFLVEHARPDQNRIAALDPLAQQGGGARVDLAR